MPLSIYISPTWARPSLVCPFRSFQKLSDLPNIEELTSAGLIDSGNVDASIFGTGKFFKEQKDEKKENIYSNIDDMLSRSLKSDED